MRPAWLGEEQRKVVTMVLWWGLGCGGCGGCGWWWPLFSAGGARVTVISGLRVSLPGPRAWWFCSGVRAEEGPLLLPLLLWLPPVSLRRVAKGSPGDALAKVTSRLWPPERSEDLECPRTSGRFRVLFPR